MPPPVSPDVQPEAADLIQEVAMLREQLNASLAEGAAELRIMRDRCEHLQRTMHGLGVTNVGFRARNSARDKLAVLTPRELAVLKAIAQGMSTKELAFQLKITFKTAVSHRTRLMAKLEIHETAGLVRLAIVAGLIPLEGG